MFEFFRRYQRYFFIVITVVIVISFSFFGTYNTMTSREVKDVEAFTAIDGQKVTRSQLDSLTFFLSTDALDKLAWGGAWGPNFLNDGVVRKDFLETGLAEMLAARYLSSLQPELRVKLEKEKHFQPYVHPRAKFIRAESVWDYFAPGLSAQWKTLRQCRSAEDPEAFTARVRLFLEEKKFPSPLLRQVLRYQEGQYEWLPEDPGLLQDDLSLFNYHTLEDWFGRRFLQLVGEFIFNAAKLAEQRGYVVTVEEAAADLRANAEKSYQQLTSAGRQPVGNVDNYMREQLRQMGFDFPRASKLWRNVLLFRRLFQEVASAVFIDQLVYDKLENYARETVSLDLYRLPSALCFDDYRVLQKFEIYLKAVAAQRPRNEGSLELPQTFLSASEVSKQTPELVQKRYLVEVAEVDKQSLQSRVGVKETWDWEIQDGHWELLTNKFPELAQASASNVEERFALLDKLELRARERVDSFVRAAIVDEHPEWLTSALESASFKKMSLDVPLQGGKLPLRGVVDRDLLIQALDGAPLASPEKETATTPAVTFSGDDVVYYRFRVLRRSDDIEVVTFAEALASGVLDEKVDKELESYYSQVREKSPELFHRPDGRWKLFADVKDQVADLYFAALIKEVWEDYVKVNDKSSAPENPTGQFAAKYRFYQRMRQARERLQEHLDSKEFVLAETPSGDKAVEEGWSKTISLQDQWKLERSEVSEQRASVSQEGSLSQAFAFEKGAWSSVHSEDKGLAFFYVKDKGQAHDSQALQSKREETARLLGAEAQRVFMKEVLDLFQEKNALQLPKVQEETSSDHDEDSPPLEMPDV